MERPKKSPHKRIFQNDEQQTDPLAIKRTKEVGRILPGVCVSHVGAVQPCRYREEEAKISYIVEGIPNDESNKAILHGATTIKELRKRLAQYETQRNTARGRMKDKAGEMKAKKSSKEDMKIKRCYNCGDKNHYGNECPNKSKGMKCFACEEFGHPAAKCPKKAGASTKTIPKARVEL